MTIGIDSVTRGPAENPPRIVLLGVEKVGKSTFAAASDRPVFIPVKGEEGIDALDVPKFPTATSYEQVIDMLGALYGQEHDYGTAVIDSVSTLEPLVWDKVCRDHHAASIEQVLKGYGKGYVEALRYWRDIMEGLDALRVERGMACILIGHVRVRTFNDPATDPYDTYSFDINEKAASALYRWSDCILFANRRTIVRTTEAGFNRKVSHGIDVGEPTLFTQKRPAHPGGGRGVYGRLPYELPLSWPRYLDAVEQARRATAIS